MRFVMDDFCYDNTWVDESIYQVFEKLRLGAKTAIEIEKMRDGYRPAAKRGAILFFVLSDLSTINTMYQYSLTSYLGKAYLLTVHCIIVSLLIVDC